MNRKIVSLMVALILCLSLFPIQALAEEAPTTEAPQVVDSGTPPEEEPSAPRKAPRAGETGDSVTLLDGFLFANGIPIIIRQNGSITSVYSEDGTLLSDGSDMGTWAVYGGWFNDGIHYSDPSVVMESGTVGAIYGGNYQGELCGSPTVTVKSGTVDYLCGGGAQSTTIGSTHVTIEGGTINYVYGAEQGGTQNGDSIITVSDGTITWLYGSSNYGTQEGNTSITIKGGRLQEVYGNGSYSALHGDVSIVMEGGTSNFVFGGGFSGSADNSRIEIRGGNPGLVYGGGSDYDSIQGMATIIVGESCNLQGNDVRLFGGGNEENATVGSACFDLSMTGQRWVQLSGEGVTGRVTAQIHGRNPAGGETVNLYEVDEVTAENCKIFLTGGLAGSSLPNQLAMDRLEIASSGEVSFGTGNESVTVGELAGSGSIIFTGLQNKMPPAIQVEKISATPQAPIKLKTEGGMPESLWTGVPWFQGSGVQNLDSSDCFVFHSDGYLVQKTADGTGIQLVKGDTRKQAYLSDAHFNQESYRYGDTMTVTMKLVGPFDLGSQPIPGATVEVRCGPGDLQTIASAVTDQDGGVTFTLPVDDYLWQNKDDGLQAAFWGNGQYKQNFYGISLNGGNGNMSFDVGKAPITLVGSIPAPVLDAAPATTFPTDSNAFYTAQLVWSPADPVFRLDRTYTASIRLIPRPGYSLDPERIEGITWNGKAVAFPTPEADGSLLLRDVASFDPIPGWYVAAVPSPAEGGTVTGGGRYPAGIQVTAVATAAPDFRFDHWEENGAFLSSDPAYTFPITGNRELTAVFLPVEKPQEVKRYELTTVPAELADRFATVEELKAALKQKVTAALTGVGDQIVMYDVRLQYLEDGVWKDVDPEHFPEAGVTAILPYPSGTNGTDYTFTVQHMISHGIGAGTVETLAYTAVPDGLQCRFTSLSPVAVGYRKNENKPGNDDDSSSSSSSSSSSPESSSSSSSSSSNGSGSSSASSSGSFSRGGSGSSSDDRDDAYDFWRMVRQKIEQAKPGDTVKVNARGYDKMPWTVMNALKKSDNITLILRWNGGKDIVLHSSKALGGAVRIYYPLSYLASYGLGSFDTAMESNKQNPKTGGA